MCMGGGGGGGFGGGGMGGGGSFAGSDFGIGAMSSGFGCGSATEMGTLGGITSPTPTVKEGGKDFLGSKPGFSEKKMQALANRSGKTSLYIS